MTTGTAADKVRRFLSQPRRMLVGGKWTGSVTGETLTSIDPATGRPLTTTATGNMKKVSLELGGKSPNIVLPDADPALVPDAAADVIFFNQGQTCTAGSRLYVHERIYDEVIGALVSRAQRIVVGPGTDPATEMGPLASDRQLSRVTDYIASGPGGHRLGQLLQPHRPRVSVRWLQAVR
ncbi:MAG TPA: aldehyde dehydrogenase family protein [Streptosporangiaceae bacterium]